MLKEVKKIRNPIKKLTIFAFTLLVTVIVYGLAQLASPVIDYKIGPSSYSRPDSECVSLADGEEKVQETFDSTIEYFDTYMPTGIWPPTEPPKPPSSGFPLASSIEERIIFRCYDDGIDAYQTNRVDTAVVYAGSVLVNFILAAVVASLLALLTYKIYKNTTTLQ